MKGSITLEARAKINLSLDVVCKRPDGYHDLRMIMQTVELHDNVTVEDVGEYTGNSAECIKVNCSNPRIPTGSDNTAYKAARAIIEKYGIKRGINIRIDKRIPVSAGLAGGSTDAAAVIKGMNQLFSLGINEGELLELGGKVGSDVPFCIAGGTMLAEGRGEILTPIELFAGVDILLIKPKFGVSTKKVFENLDLNMVIDRPDTDLLIRAVRNKETEAIAKNMKNVLETVTVRRYGVLNEIKEKLITAGAIGSMMSGSGPTVFGIFPARSAAEAAYKRLNDRRWKAFITRTI